MKLTAEQEKCRDEVVQLTKDSWDAGWRAACEEFVRIADEKGYSRAIAAMRTYI